MKEKIVAILLVALIIRVTPAAAIQFEEMTQTVDMTVRGRGVVAASQITEQVESEQTAETGNETLPANVENSTTETYASDTSTEQIIIGDPAPAEATGADTQYLNDSLDNYTVNVTVPQIDTTGVVMQSTNYSCGPAALATVLQNIGISVTEGELKVLVGTDTSGTSMYGLVRAAHAKGVNAVGMRLSIDELRPNHIVHVVIDGTAHFSAVREITETSVKLSDPKLGNIVMGREKFSEVFTGNVLVISGPKKLIK